MIYGALVIDYNVQHGTKRVYIIKVLSVDKTHDVNGYGSLILWWWCNQYMDLKHWDIYVQELESLPDKTVYKNKFQEKIKQFDIIEVKKLKTYLAELEVDKVRTHFMREYYFAEDPYKDNYKFAQDNFTLGTFIMKIII